MSNTSAKKNEKRRMKRIRAVADLYDAPAMLSYYERELVAMDGQKKNAEDRESALGILKLLRPPGARPASTP